MILRKAVMRCDLPNKDDDIYQKLKKLSGGKYLIGESGKPFNEKEVNGISDLIWAELTKPESIRMKFTSIWKNIPVYDLKLQFLGFNASSWPWATGSAPYIKRKKVC